MNLTRTALLGLGFCAVSAFSENYVGKVYPLSGGDQLLYTFSRRYTKSGANTQGIGEYKSPEGKLVVEEKTMMEGAHVLEHSVVQHQVNESGKVSVEGKKVHFSYTKDGQEKHSEEDVVPNLVVSATLVPYIQEHWNEIESGKTVEIRYAALDRRETVGFDLFKVEDKRSKTGQIAVKMKPSSFIIAAIVNPLFLMMDTKTHALTEIYGRTAPKQNDGGKWKDLDAHTVYEVVK